MYRNKIRDMKQMRKHKPPTIKRMTKRRGKRK